MQFLGRTEKSNQPSITLQFKSCNSFKTSDLLSQNSITMNILTENINQIVSLTTEEKSIIEKAFSIIEISKGNF